MTVGQSLATRLHARLLLLHVLERRAPATVHGDRHLRRFEEAEAYFRDAAARWGQQGGVDVELLVHRQAEDNVPKSIVDHAAQLGADLILLSTHGAGGARRALFGSVAQQVLSKGTHPVLLVRAPASPAEAPMTFRRILIPLDGRRPSRAALPLASAFAAAFGAELRVLTMVPTLSSVPAERTGTALLAPSATAASLELEKARAGDDVAELLAGLRARGLRASGVVRRGDPARGIVDEAARSAPDMIAMATRGRTGLGALFAGSVVAEIMGKLPQPILLVRI